MKKLDLTSLIKMTVCCCILLTAQGYASENEKVREKQPAGTRALKVHEHVAIQERRIEQEESREEQSCDTAERKEILFNIDEERTTTDLEEKESHTTKGFVTKDLYYTTHEGVYHNAIAVAINGDTVELEDGSCWSVSYWDRPKVMNWFTTDRVIVTQSLSWFSSYYYQLVNLETGHKVSVNLSVKPFYNGYYTHWVKAVDPVLNQVYLDDGSVWVMDIYDRDIVRTWLRNDTLIIGINECKNPSCPSNILINAETLEYARGICLN